MGNEILWGDRFLSMKIIKTIAIFCFLNILYVTELPEVFWTLGTRLSLVLSFFTLRNDFMDLKKPLTLDEQLDKLIEHGMVISDREEAKDILKKVNYYLLRAMLCNLGKPLPAVIT